MLQPNKKIIDLLDAFGLSATEQDLYLTGLTKVDTTVSELIALTKINRTTAYHALGTLKQKGFVTEAREQGTLIYNMTKPEELDSYLDRRLVEIENQRQQLKSVSILFPRPVSKQTATQVEKFDGIEAVKEAIDRALYCRAKEWRIIAPRDNFFSQVGADYANYFMNTRRRHGIKARSLWEPNSKDAKLSLRDLFERHPRYLPKELAGRFKSVIILYDDKALLISSAQNPSAVLVGSSELVSTLVVLFDGLWLLAQNPAVKH